MKYLFYQDNIYILPNLSIFDFFPPGISRMSNPNGKAGSSQDVCKKWCVPQNVNLRLLVLDLDIWYSLDYTTNVQNGFAPTDISSTF